MTTEVPFLSNQWNKQESMSQMNNISIRTGEKFSMELLQDHHKASKVHNRNDKVWSNGNHHCRYEELGVVLGLQRVDSVCSSDIADNGSERISVSKPNAPLQSSVSDDSQRGKIKFICSSGGKILPRPSDGKLRYVGGETRIVSIQKNISFEELVKRTSEFCNHLYTVKYQLPGEDLDALISVSSNEDLQNMIEEYNGLGNLDGSTRLRIFLIPLTDSEITCTVEDNTNQQKNPDYQYVVAVNGIVDHNPPRKNDSRCLKNEDNQLKSADTTDVIMGSDANGTHPVMSHTYSDPQLQELGGNSCFEFVVLQEKFSEQNENVHLQVVTEIPNVKQSVLTGQMEHLKRVSDDAYCIDEKQQTAKQDLEKTVLKENIPTFDQADSFINNILSATTNGVINKASKVNYPEKSYSDLLSGFSVNISHESSAQLSSSHLNVTDNQKMMLIGNDNLGHLVQNPTTGAGLRKEFSLMDDDFPNYTKQEVGNMGPEGCFSNLQKEVPFIMDKKDNQLELVDLLGDVTDAAGCSHGLDAVSTEAHLSNATEAENTLSDSNVEDGATVDNIKDVPFSNALIAEMEADMYGLQIIKNAELEELRELGSGTYGTVFHGRWRGSDVAIKRIKKSCFAGRSSEEERLTNDFWREARILSNLHHPNVVAFYGVVPDAAGGTLATVTEFMANGSLRNVLIKKDRSLDPRRKLLIAMDAAFGMEYLHSKNIVHFDLKCDNLLVNMRDPQRPVCKVRNGSK